MSQMECPHCRFPNASGEVYCRQCQRPMRDTASLGQTHPRQAANKRVKIWFDDEGEPHETLVDEGAPEPPQKAAPATRAAPVSPRRKSQVWFDDEGEPHDSSADTNPNAPPPQFSPKKAQVYFDNEGEPHETLEAATAANMRLASLAERTQISPPPPQAAQTTHSAFTQGLTPKPMYFERVETARDIPPRSVHEQTVPRPSPLVQGRPTEPVARLSAAPEARAQAPQQPAGAQAPAQARSPQGAPQSPRSTAANLGTPVPQRAATPQARSPSPQPSGQSPQQPSPLAQSAQPTRAPAAPRELAPQTVGQRVMAPQPQTPQEDPEAAVERTVISPQPMATPTAKVLPAQAPKVGGSSSLATNHRAAQAHAAMMDGGTNRPAGEAAPRRAQQPPSNPPLVDGYPTNERTVATPTPTSATFATTLTPTAGRPSVASQGPVVQRPTLTHTPVPMENRAQQATRKKPVTGGFFNRTQEPSGTQPSSSQNGFFDRASEGPTPAPGPAPGPAPAPNSGLISPSGAPLGESLGARPTVKTPEPDFFLPPTEPTVLQPPMRRITDAFGAPIGPVAPIAPPQPPVAPVPMPQDEPGETVHEQATVVRESPFLQSEPTVVRSPVIQQEEPAEAPMRRRLTEPLLARGQGFVAPAHQGIQTEPAPLWRLTLASIIDGGVALLVGTSTAAAEMLMFGGHWPAEATNILDAVAMWMHNYPGTEKRALLVMILFAWAYTALGARTGRTLGRMLLRLIAIGQDGDMMTWPKAALRAAVGLVSTLCFGAGFFWAIVDGQHRAIHDIASQSVVVRRKSA